MSTKNNSDALGPPDKKQKNGLKVYRADYLPDFVTEDWVRGSIGLTLQDQTITAKYLAKLLPSWDGKEGKNKTFHAKITRDLGIVHLINSASGNLYQTKNSKRPLFLKKVNDTIFAHLSFEERKIKERFSDIEARKFLIDKEAWEDLSQVVFCDILYNTELENVETLLAKHGELNKVIYPFFNSYKDQRNKFDKRNKDHKRKEHLKSLKLKAEAQNEKLKKPKKSKTKAPVQKTNKTRVSHDDGTNVGSAFFKGIINKINNAKGKGKRTDLTDLINEVEELSLQQIVTETKFQSQVDEKITELVLSLKNYDGAASTISEAIRNGDTAATANAAATTLQFEEKITEVISELKSILAKVVIGKNVGTSPDGSVTATTKIVHKTEVETNLEDNPQKSKKEEFTKTQTSAEEIPKDPVSIKINMCIANLLRRQHPGLAYYVQLINENILNSKPFIFSTPILRLYTISPSIRGPLDKHLKVTQSLVEEIKLLMPKDPDDVQIGKEIDDGTSWTEVNEALLVAGALEPALFSRESGAIELIARKGRPYMKHLGAKFSKLNDVITPIADLPSKGLRDELTPATIGTPLNQTTSLQASERHREKLKKWFKQAKNKKPIGLARNVWQELIKPKGEIGRVIVSLIENKAGAIQTSRQFLDKLSSSGAIDALINPKDKRFKRNPLSSKSKTAVRGLVSEAITYTNSYIGFLATSQGKRADHDEHVIGDFRRELSSALDAANLQIKDWQEANNNNASDYMIAAVNCLEGSLVRLEKIIDGSFTADIKTHSEPELTGRDLSLVCGIQFEGPWSPNLQQPDTVITAIEEFLGSHPFDYLAVFSKQLEDQNHIATTHILNRLRDQDDTDISPRKLEELSKVQSEAIKTSRLKLKENLEDIEKKLNRATALNLITDGENTLWLEGVKAITPEELPNTTILPNNDVIAQLNDTFRISDFPLAEKFLNDIKQNLSDRESKRCEDFERDINQLKDKNRCNSDDAETVKRQIRAGDLLLVENSIRLLKEGEGLTKEPKTNEYIRKFTHFYEDISNNVKRNKKTSQITKEDVDHFQNGNKLLGKLGNVPGGQRDNINTLLRSWTGLGGASTATINRLRNVLRILGFTVLESGITEQTHRSTKYPEFKMHCRAIEDREICPVPHYGSEASGTYQIIVVNKEASPRELADAATSNANSTTILLYRNVMSQQHRKAFIEAIHNAIGETSALLIDDAVILYLCEHENTDKLPVLFQITLPYAKTIPYFRARGKIPIELFYGRKDEQGQIAHKTGSNLVYGGRMLGKTALLRQVQLRGDRPENNEHIIYQDLKIADGLFTAYMLQQLNTDPEVIWELIAEHLSARKVIKIEKSNDKFKPDNIRSKIHAWINEEPDRSILLLLDEADIFLELDAKLNHPNLGMFKNLMDDTQGRFKVVMAGLHNVQRITKDANSPMGRMGQPICIGPLADQDRIEASNLITEPLSACGYEFESYDLVQKIQSETNSYPSLIQIYCDELLKYIRKQTSILRGGPPYIIDKAIIDEASQVENMRNGIIEGFNITLNLDKRYKLIAYAIALAVHDDESDNQIVQGYDASKIRGLVLYWGGGPFGEDTSPIIFGTLLDEMVGLGLLTKSPDDLYQLYSVSVRTLLGTRAEIEDNILSLADEEPTPNYNPRGNHMVRGSITSPLTMSQEIDLLQEFEGRQPNLFLIFGSKIAGIDQVKTVIELKANEEKINFDTKSSQITNLNELQNLIKKNPQKRKKRSIIVVPRGVPWTANWVSKALDWPEIKQRRINLYFLGGGNAALDWIENGKPGLNKDNVHITSITPWSSDAVMQWIENEGLSTALQSKQQIQILKDKTGFLTQRLVRFREIHGKRHDIYAALKDLEKEIRDADDPIDSCGIPTSMRRLIGEIGDYANSVDGALRIDERDIEVLANDVESQIDISHIKEWGDLMALWQPAPEEQLNLSKVIFDIVGLRT